MLGPICDVFELGNSTKLFLCIFSYLPAFFQRLISEPTGFLIGADHNTLLTIQHNEALSKMKMWWLHDAHFYVTGGQ